MKFTEYTQILKTSAIQTGQLLKTQWQIFGALFLSTEVARQISIFTRLRTVRTPGDKYDIIFLVTWSVVDMILITFLILLLTRAYTKIKRPQDSEELSFASFTAKNLGPLINESIRAWGLALLWLFALIVPGLIRFVRYSMIPMVITLDPKYHCGEVDALSRSNQLVRGITFGLMLITALLMTLNITIDTLRMPFFFTAAPVQTGALAACSFFISVYIYIVSIEIYLKRVKDLS